MPWGSVRLKPGVNVEQTPTLLEAGIATSSMIRFRDYLAEKLGGWVRFYPFTVSGVPKALHAWADLNSANHLAVGTTSELGVITSGNLQDVTPQTFLSNGSIGAGAGQLNFSTVINTPTVTVVDNNISNLTTLDFVFFDTPIYISGSGIVLSGLYPIASIVGTHSYSITAAVNATGTVNNLGHVPIFTTTNGSSTVSVEIDDHGVTAGQQVVFPILTTGNGVTILGAYIVLTITDANDFTIAAGNQATASSAFNMNGGNVQLLYYINLGPPAVGVGYGLGGYGLGGYGTGVVPASQTGTPIVSTDWTLGNWGEILIACPKGGGIYQFDPTGGYQNAGLISGAPIFNTGVLVAMPQQMLFTFGSTVQTALGPQHDPMECAWCDVSNFNQWTALSQDQAGKFRISPGSMIVGGRQGPNNILLWTDLDLWTVTYLGPPLVWGFNKVAGGSGLIGLRAHCELGGTVYWMGQSNFYQAGPEGVGVLECSIWDVVFQNLFTANDSSGLPAPRKCWAWANTPSNEVWFFYPSLAANGGIDSYVKYNKMLKTWDYGPMARSCGIDQSVLGKPISTTGTGLIYQHETSPDADGAPLAWSFTTGYFMLGEGEDSVFIDLIIPDFKFGLFGGSSQNAAIQISMNIVDDPSGQLTVFGPYTVTSTTPEIQDLRIRGRMGSFTIGGNDVGSFARMGRVRYRWAPDGKHP